MTSEIGVRRAGPSPIGWSRVGGRRVASTWFLGVLAALVTGCGQEVRLAGPAPDPPQVPPAVLTSALVSEPIAKPAASVAQPTAGPAPQIVYVSLPPGTLPTGETVTIRNRTTGAQATAVLANGGWDPVPISATVGDTLLLAIAAKGGSSSEFMYVVPPGRRPVVVRTDPPPGKRDVPLNATFLVVFSEPINPATITPQSVRLVLDGQPVAGRAELSSDGLRAVVRADLGLAPITGYVLSVSAEVADLAGDPLERAVDVPFTTAGELPPGTGSRVAAGYLMTCALSEAGRAYCWGQDRWQGDSRGRLGIDPVTLEPCVDTFFGGPSFPIAALCATKPVPVRGGLVFRSITAGGEGHICGLTPSGRAYCWGGNSRGQLGTGSTSSAETPIPVQGELVFHTLAAGLAFTCGLTTTGQAYCWGTDGLAGVGTSTQAIHVTPQLVVGGRTFATLVAGTNHACALTSVGAAYCWGFNNDGQLGIGDTPLELCYLTERCAREPLPVVGDLRWKGIAAGFLRTCGLATSANVYCWGRPFWQDPHGPSSAPVSIGAAIPAFVSLADGWHGTSCGITATGEAWCWGLQIGTGFYSEVPVRVADGLSLRELAIGDGHMCGFTTGNELYCWGYNESGAVGAGTLEFHYSTPQLVHLP